MTTTTTGRHPDDDELVLHHYGEDEAGWVGEHLADCADCRASAETLGRTLRLVRIPAPDGPDELAMQRIRRGVARATAPDRTANSTLAPGRRRRVLAAVAAAAVLATVAFLAGRLSGPVGDPLDGELRERARLLAVADHLERSRRALTTLAGTPDAADGAFQRERAADLAAFNRLHRQVAGRAGDVATGRLLEDLERILLDVANADELDTATVDDLQRRVTRQDLLYRLRLGEETARGRAAPLTGGQRADTTA